MMKTKSIGRFLQLDLVAVKQKDALNQSNVNLPCFLIKDTILQFSKHFKDISCKIQTKFKSSSKIIGGNL